jgi:uncharacterized repeat protein (TIGR01451 family)
MMIRVVKRITLAGLLATFASSIAVGTAPAIGATPGVAWSVQAIAEPTSFQTTDTTDEQQAVTVTATGGTFTLRPNNGETAALPFDADAATVQAALAALGEIGPGNVTVSGGPGDATGSSPYVITFTGALHGVTVPLLRAESAALTGSSPHVSVFEREAGSNIDKYAILVSNVGSQTSSGPLTVTDTLPPGVTTISGIQTEGGFSCTPTEAGQSVITCVTEFPFAGQTQAGWIVIPVSVAPGTPQAPLTNEVLVSGGGAPDVVHAAAPTSIGGAVPAFSLLGFTASALDLAGGLDTQAGGHPAALVSDFDVPSAVRPGVSPQEESADPVQSIRRTVFDLPAGLVGDPQAAPTCSLAALADNGRCPLATQVGVLGLVSAGKEPALSLSIFNIAPEHGYPAEFGVFEPRLQRPVLLYGSVVGNGADTHVRVTSAPLPRAVPTIGVSVIFYGDPAQQDFSPNSPIAFAGNPSNCNAPSFTTTLHADTWQSPGASNLDGTPDLSDPNWRSTSADSPPVTACNALHFEPSFSLQPDTAAAGSPAGLAVDLHVPQKEDPNSLQTPPLRDAVVTLPQGLVVNPSSANGLQGCSSGEIDVSSNDPSSCPPASQIGTVLVETPLLGHALPGVVYLGDPECAPCSDGDAQAGRLVRLYIEVDDPVTGIVVKLPGSVSLDPASGRLQATFAENPQFPFEDLKLRFKSGATAPLVTPVACGAYATTTDLKPWSAPDTPDATPSSGFQVGEGCGARGFAPLFSSGTLNNQAGGYSPLVLSFSRADSDQEFLGLQETLPPGLLAKLAGVPRCADAQASVGSCADASQIGTVTVGAGAGPDPFYVTGKVFLTGPYNGGPFGEVVVVPAVAGPFDLGTVVVRGSIRIDPHTAQASIVSDAFPTKLDGIPLRVKAVNVDVDRPGFTFNPTSCAALSVTGVLSSAQGASAAVSSRFQAANCASLPFKPVFAASTQAKTSKARGASLAVTVRAGAGQANIGRVDLQLPKQLPARLTTLQKACTEGQFNRNPAGCPVASVIGTAKAVTPLLDVPLVGPAYLVSHGGAAFPDVEFLLQGEGVLIELDGKTQIKKGITYSHFETVPDAPISTFQTTLPEGPYSVLATDIPAQAKSSLCGLALNIPTTLTAHNGALLRQTTKVAVTGCAKAKIKTLTRAQKLTKALKACKKDKAKTKRTTCEKQARKQYGPQAKKKTTKTRKR